MQMFTVFYYNTSADIAKFVNKIGILYRARRRMRCYFAACF